jgi:hypothetical protein
MHYKHTNHFKMQSNFTKNKTNVPILMVTSTQCILSLTLEYHMSISCIPPCKLEGMAHPSIHHSKSSHSSSDNLDTFLFNPYTTLETSSLSAIQCRQKSCIPNIGYIMENHYALGWHYNPSISNLIMASHMTISNGIHCYNISNVSRLNLVMI